MAARFLTVLPVYNEMRHVADVLDEVLRYSPEVLVVDDGSTDGTSELLGRRSDLHVVKHSKNRGYGAALRSAFQFALYNDYDVLVTIDCDGQHQPRLIPEFVSACIGLDIVSGSRYLKHFEGDSEPPTARRKINEQITAEINCRLGLKLTDAFCGFKAYSVPVLAKFNITEPGYAMPLELWVQAAYQNFKIKELPVPLIYLEEARSFGGSLDNSEMRLQHYREVIDRSMAALRGRIPALFSKRMPCSGATS
ncbi:MAG TPA: glycosyltransferase family 2 protein [Pirellulales bacterium]|jgi:dolichol-phosphate mannosyltransferase|nr:glycosyltransferase family 2 protein [Pirellulales bacterium]